MTRQSVAAIRLPECGTRGRYVSGCRCDACRASNLAYYHARMARRRELEGGVTPSGPPLRGSMLRAGVLVPVNLCPGANGAACVKPGTWLKGRSVCAPCVERATVWNGSVDAAPARAHMLALRDQGVGTHTVASASDVARCTLQQILSGTKTSIRRAVERAILDVDVSAIADGALVDGTRTREIIARLVARGFTREHLSELLGATRRPLQRAKNERVWAITEARVERIEKRVLAGELVPERATVDAAAERAWIDLMLERGESASHLSDRLGFVVRGGSKGRMFPHNRDAVRALRAEYDAIESAEKVRAILARTATR